MLLYGHLDKQPEMTGWSKGKGPWTPVLEGDRLYGRGAADDGYAIFGSLAAPSPPCKRRAWRMRAAWGDRGRNPAATIYLTTWSI